MNQIVFDYVCDQADSQSVDPGLNLMTTLGMLLKDSLLRTLTKDEQSEIYNVPLKTASGHRTALAEELSVDLSPTLVVVHEDLLCAIDKDGDEFCDYEAQSVERFIGAKAIIQHLDATLDAYTYSHPE